MFKFSKKSKSILSTVNKYLAMSAELTISKSKIDISIPEWGGLRTAEYQKELFDKGWSKADGTTDESNHQRMDEECKSKALDLCAYYKGKQNWNAERLVYFAGIMLDNFETLKSEKRIPNNLYLHWGGYWTPRSDGLGWDLPHFEIKDKKQTIRI